MTVILHCVGESAVCALWLHKVLWVHFCFEILQAFPVCSRDCSRLRGPGAREEQSPERMGTVPGHSGSKYRDTSSPYRHDLGTLVVSSIQEGQEGTATAIDGFRFTHVTSCALRLVREALRTRFADGKAKAQTHACGLNS